MTRPKEKTLLQKLVYRMMPCSRILTSGEVSRGLFRWLKSKPKTYTLGLSDTIFLISNQKKYRCYTKLCLFKCFLLDTGDGLNVLVKPQM